jgi:8-oxo-dGTP diphosphatase
MIIPKPTKISRKNWIPVVAGFLKKDNLILLGQRPENQSLPGQWEFPGGKIELGESPEFALQRELQEELGIDAKIGEIKLSVTHCYNDVGIVILFYDVPYWKGEPKPRHHMKIEWINPNEMAQKTIPETNRKHLDRILKIILNQKE